MDFPEPHLDRRPGAEHRPTLLVFTLGARHESRRRQLLPANLNPVEDRLHQACLESTLAAGRAADCRLEVSSPCDLALPSDVAQRKQQGADFGARLQRATAEAFEAHGGPVLLVGSDVPDLEVSHLRQSLRVLEDDPDQVVIGPSPDGGFYLLAAARPLDGALAEVRWQCRHTLRSLKRALRKEGRKVVLLPPLVDLDHRSDLEHWLARARQRPVHWRIAEGRRLIARLTAILAQLRHRAASEVFRLSARLSAPALSLRGPPVPAF